MLPNFSVAYNIIGVHFKKKHFLKTVIKELRLEGFFYSCTEKIQQKRQGKQTKKNMSPSEFKNLMSFSIRYYEKLMNFRGYSLIHNDKNKIQSLIHNTCSITNIFKIFYD